MKTNSNIKIYVRLALSLAFTTVFMSGCEDDFLDKQPLDQLSTATFWKSEGDAMLALSGIYHLEGTNGSGAKQQFSFWNQDTHLRVFEATTDNGFEKDDQVTDFNNGDMASSNSVIGDLWENAYLKIAKCNNFMDNISTVEMDAQKKAMMIAEVRTIRAFDYFYLLRNYGTRRKRPINKSST